MTGDMVKEIQKKVGFKGKDVDGKFGLATHNAVRNFQLKKDLVPDGEAGPKTLAAMGLSNIVL
jgi:N-acetylmuramoyl-L-alanine amidase